VIKYEKPKNLQSLIEETLNYLSKNLTPLSPRLARPTCLLGAIFEQVERLIVKIKQIKRRAVNLSAA
jgi:hypothetical protein